jgi:predicted acyl esterase
MQTARRCCAAIFTIAMMFPLHALAQRPTPDQQLIAKRNATEKELEAIAMIDRKVMVTMRDGKRMQADIYRPKDASKKYPVIFSRTPYNFNYWDVALGAPSDMTHAIEAVKHGYALVEMNERGRFFLRRRLRHSRRAVDRRR